MRKLNSVWFMAFSVVLGLLSLLMMFVPLFNARGTVYNATTGFFNSGFTAGAWPAFVGFMLILVTTIAVFVISLPNVQISFKTEKLVLLGGAFLNVIGLVLIMLITVEFNGFNEWRYAFGKDIQLYPGAYLASFFALLAAGCNIVALNYDKD